MKIPAVCENCGLVFPSPIAIQAPSKMSSLFCECPNCRSESKIVDGYFELIDGLVKLIEGPEFSREILAVMYESAQHVRRSPQQRDQAIEAVAGRSPEAAVVLQGWINIGIQFAILMVTLTALVLECKEGKDNRPTIEIAIDNADILLNNYVEQLEVNDIEDQQRGPSALPQSYRAIPGRPTVEHSKNRKQRRAELADVRRGRIKR